MITWNYPLPYSPDDAEPVSSASGSQLIHHDTAAAEKSPSLLLESLQHKALYRAIGTLPTDEETREITRALPKTAVKLQEGKGSALERVYEGYIETLAFRVDNPNHLAQKILWGDQNVKVQRPLTILALDCEMCDTEV